MSKSRHAGGRRYRSTRSAADPRIPVLNAVRAVRGNVLVARHRHRAGTGGHGHDDLASISVEGDIAMVNPLLVTVSQCTSQRCVSHALTTPLDGVFVQLPVWDTPPILTVTDDGASASRAV